jgi:UMF1 family MFS transporter
MKPQADTPSAAPAARSATGEQPSDLRGQYAWALFEFARSPYLSLVYIYVFAPYFASTVIGDPLRGQEVWSFANTLVGVFVAILAPLLGAISDRTGGRKPWLLALVAMMAPGCMILWWAMPGAEGGLPLWLIVAVIVLLATCFQFTDLFHSAMLPSLAGPARIGGLSGLGISTGNAGSMVALVIMLLGVALPAAGTVHWPILPQRPLFGLDPALNEHNRVAGPAAGLWFIVFSVPLFLWTPDRSPTGISAERAVREGLAQLWITIAQARRLANVGLYLVARTLYTDGKVAIIAYAGIYAAGTFAWDAGALILFGLLLTPFAIAGGLLGGWIDNRFGSKRAIQISVGGTIVAMGGAVSMTPDTVFFVPWDGAASGPVWPFPYFRTVPEILYLIMFMSLSATVTAAFANSRAMMARLAPVSMMNQFFGLYGMAGTATAFLGHGLVATFTRAFESQRAGFASTVLLLAIGLALLHFVREERAEEIA